MERDAHEHGSAASSVLVLNVVRRAAVSLLLILCIAELVSLNRTLSRHSAAHNVFPSEDAKIAI